MDDSFDFDDEPFDDAALAEVDHLEALYSGAASTQANTTTQTTNSRPSTTASRSTSTLTRAPVTSRTPPPPKPPPAHTFRPASHAPPRPGPSTSRPTTTAPCRPAHAPAPVAVISLSDSDEYGSDLDIDESAQTQLDALEASYIASRPPTNAPGLRQQTLWGVAPPDSNRPREKPREVQVQKKHTGPKKQWDKTAFAKTGFGKRKEKRGRGGRAGWDDEDEEEMDEDEELVEGFEQFPAWQDPLQPALPMKHSPDRQAIQKWTYPTNMPIREYQFNIVRECLFDNTLVSLPTGLGKTFIAGVVMLNYYRWFPTGKIVFVAPTKPLVAQQIEACHKTCGIPGRDSISLTGENPKREVYWESKRVMYMTPQTLYNDLLKGTGDARDIVLLVIDEAHRATGDYAYCKVVRLMMQKNPHFRIMALTATPGKDSETVQMIIDNLHIGHIEIRDETAPDLKPFLYKKVTTEHTVKFEGVIAEIRNNWSTLMNSEMKVLREKELLQGHVRPEGLHPYRLTAMKGTIGKDPRFRNMKWLYGKITKIEGMARAMQYLQDESLGMFRTQLLQFKDGKGGAGGKKTASAMNDNKLVDECLRLSEDLRAETGAFGHPKMDKLQALILDHFVPDGDGDADAERPESRVIVFASYREVVEEIVQVLNQNAPLIRAKQFIGQSADKKGNKGYTQKDQLKAIEDFKKGVYNVLVSTSIGEEGLDIGEIDFIVAYDTNKSPVRMLQRIGRTGRKRDGIVHVLHAEGCDKNWQAAKDSYRDVQRHIIRGDLLALYDDCERLLPDEVEPQCEKVHVPIDAYAAEEPAPPKGAGSAADLAAKKRKRDPKRNIPEGASSGFVSAGALVPNGKGKGKGNGGKKAAARKSIGSINTDEDSDDEAIEAGLEGVFSAVDNDRGKGKGKEKGKEKEPVKPRPRPRPSAAAVAATAASSAASLSLRAAAAIDIDSDDDSSPPKLPFPIASNSRNAPRPEPSPAPASSNRVAPLGMRRPPPKPPPLVRKASPARKSASPAPLPPQPTAGRGTSFSDMDMWMLDEDSDVDMLAQEAQQAAPPPPPPSQRRRPPALPPLKTPARGSVPLVDSSSPLPEPVEKARQGSTGRMLPPPFPVSIGTSSASKLESPASIDASQFVRRPGARVGGSHRKGRPIISSSPRDSPNPLRRLRPRSSSPVEGHSTSSVPRPKRAKVKRRPVAFTQNNLFDLDARLSGDEDEEGDERTSEMEMSEGDLRFIANDDSPASQINTSYDQHAMYRAGLSTQIPGAGGPAFAKPAVRPGGFGMRFIPRRPGLGSSSSPAMVRGSGGMGSEDSYDLDDGFCVPDDADEL